MSQSATSIKFKLYNGKEIPGLGLGTVASDVPSDVKNQVKTAIIAGFRHIDTAWAYDTEKFVGEAIRESIEEGLVKREDLFVTTKVWPTFHKDPEKSLNKSLKALGLDYVDLYLQHWPLAFKAGEDGLPRIPKDNDGNVIFDDDSEETSFVDFYKRIEKVYLENPDKVRSIGVSNYSIKLLETLLPIVEVKPAVNQIEYHPQLPQQDLIDYATEKGIHITAYSPVGSRGAPVLKLPFIHYLATKYEVTSNEIANAYHILQGRSVLPRSSNLDRIKTIVRLPELTEEELKQLYQIGVENPTRYINPPWGKELGFQFWYSDTGDK